MEKEEKRAQRQKWIETLGGFDGGLGPTEKYKNKILVDCIEDLEDSINANSKESSRLSKVLIVLNVVLAVATLFLAIIGGTNLYFKIVDHTNQRVEFSTDMCK